MLGPALAVPIAQPFGSSRIRKPAGCGAHAVNYSRDLQMQSVFVSFLSPREFWTGDPSAGVGAPGEGQAG